MVIFYLFSMSLIMVTSKSLLGHLLNVGVSRELGASAISVVQLGVAL